MVTEQTDLSGFSGEVIIETPFSLPGGKVLIMYTDRPLPSKIGIYGAQIIPKENYVCVLKNLEEGRI